jgi:hypothetical protein
MSSAAITEQVCSELQPPRSAMDLLKNSKYVAERGLLRSDDFFSVQNVGYAFGATRVQWIYNEKGNKELNLENFQGVVPKVQIEKVGLVDGIDFFQIWQLKHEARFVAAIWFKLNSQKPTFDELTGLFGKNWGPDKSEPPKDYVHETPSHPQGNSTITYDVDKSTFVLHIKASLAGDGSLETVELMDEGKAIGSWEQGDR